MSKPTNKMSEILNTQSDGRMTSVNLGLELSFCALE